MTKLRERASEVYQAGVEARGDWSPPALPRKIYGYWADLRQHKVPQRENFCHFWRVVMIWSPLWALANGIYNVLVSTVFHVVLAVTAVAGITWAWSTIGFNLVPIWFLMAAVYFVGGIASAVLYISAHDVMSTSEKRWMIVAQLATFPVSGAVWALYLTAVGIDKFTRSGAGRATWAVLKNAAPWIFLALFLAGVSGVTISYGWEFLLGVFLGSVIVVALGALWGLLSIWISGRRAIREQKRIAEFFEQADNNGEHPQDSREPGRVKKFFTAVGDMIIFVAQVVRVKKWKICPMVTINE